MTIIQSFLFFLVSFGASIIGAICGIGGGVIIKPTLDMFGWVSVSTISFLSGCTVLSMSCYSVAKSMTAKEKSVDLKTVTPLAIGAAIGGVMGSHLFSYVKSLFADPNMAGAVQAGCLAIVTLGTLLYTIFKAKIKVHHMQGAVLCLIIGLLLGIMSSFLGIGGGPINLVVLFFFFGMDTKTAASNSLYIILFSQFASVMTTIIKGNVPAFQLITLLFMVFGGISGGMVGRKVNKRLDNKAVDKLFLGLMAVIILISIYNMVKYLNV